MFGFLGGLVGRYGDVVRFDLGRSPVILVNAAAEVRRLLLEHWVSLRKPEFLKDSNRGHWGDGLTTLEGAAWRARRQMLRPSFGGDRVAARLPVVEACTRDLVETWQPGDVIDLRRALRLLTARIAARTILDAEVEGWEGAASAARSGVLPLAEIYGEDYASAPGGDPTAPLVMVRPRAPRGMDVTISLIEERMASGQDRGDVLSELLRARGPGGERLGRDAVVGEIVQMLYAGHHTIPGALVSFWHDLARHGPVARRVADEARRLGAADTVGVPALSSSYCAAVLRESMRVHPPAPILYREVATAFELAGYAFEPDFAVWVCPQLLHHDPRNFPEPDRFRPERFAGGMGGGAPGAYLPFGAGPRTCIGNRLAMHQMTCIALLVAARHELEPFGPPEPDFRVVTRF
jgi:cytochrome P450